MIDSTNTTETVNTVDNDVNYDDIPELTAEDFARAVKNPFAGKFRDGYTIIVEHADHDEVITVTKKRKPKGSAVAESATTYRDS